MHRWGSRKGGRVKLTLGRRVDVPGERLAGMPVRLSGLGLARGALGKLGKQSSRFGRLDRTPQFLSERRAATSESTPEASA